MSDELISLGSNVERVVLHTPGVCLYGPGRGHTSIPRVVGGIWRGLQQHGLLGGFCATDGGQPDEGAPPGEVGLAGYAVGRGACARYGLHEGGFNTIGMMRSAGFHERRFAMVAMNSTFCPDKLEDIFAGVEVVTPSQWSKEVLLQVFPEERVSVYRHGVADEFGMSHLNLWAEADRQYAKRRFEVLHLSSTAIHGPSTRSRKGTIELLQAWTLFHKRIENKAEVRLSIIQTGGTATLIEAIHEWCPPAVAKTVRCRGTMNAPLANMAAFYPQFHVVCQPSRGEGFGLVPLEARAAGVVTVATRCTGHTEHIGPGDTASVVVIPTGPLSPIDDGPGALAPSVAAEDIAEALDLSYSNWGPMASLAREQAPRVAADWSWGRTTADWLKSVGIGTRSEER